jgi:hypothetical protein
MKHAFVNSFCHHLHKPRNDPSVQLPIPYSFRSRLEKSDLNSPRSPNHHSAFIIHLFPLFVPLRSSEPNPVHTPFSSTHQGGYHWYTWGGY